MKVFDYTVAIPVYNGKSYIARTIKSLIAQTIPPKEVILVDDCSTDGTADFVEREFGWVKVVRQATNQGVASARNQAIRRCVTPVIMLLDADDLWLPTKAQEQLNLLEKAPDISGVFCDFRGVDLEGNPVCWAGGILAQLQGYRLDPQLVDDHAYVLNKDVPSALIQHTSFIHPSVVCFYTDAIQKIGGFDETYRHIEDLELWIRFASKYRLGYIDKILMEAESRPDSLGKRRIPANEGLVRLYSSLKVDYPQIASRNKFAIREFLKVRYAYLSELYMEQQEYQKAWTACRNSLGHGVSRRGLSCLYHFAKSKLISR
jgi:glycosyltransferase involved in cell wall biosynthesis